MFVLGLCNCGHIMLDLFHFDLQWSGRLALNCFCGFLKPFVKQDVTVFDLFLPCWWRHHSIHLLNMHILCQRVSEPLLDCALECRSQTLLYIVKGLRPPLWEKQLKCCILACVSTAIVSSVIFVNSPYSSLISLLYLYLEYFFLMLTFEFVHRLSMELYCSSFFV